MLRNYFKVALRHLRKNKLYTIVNVLGLSIGIISCILIGLYIFNELSYDKFHANRDKVARVTMEYRAAGTVNQTAVTGTKVGPQFKRTFPAVQAFSRTIKYSRVIGYGDKVFDEKKVLYADSAFFKIFSFPLIQGDENNALRNTESIVLTESMAKKYFGREDAIGKTVSVSSTKDYIVTAVAKDVPGNSQIQFDFVIPFNSLISPQEEEQWWSANYVTYLLLHQPSQISTLSKEVKQYMQRVTKEELKMEGSDYLTYHLEPLKRVHLYSSLDGLEPNGNIAHVYALSIIAMLILVIACVNYTNLATAQSAGRGTEVGIRKVMGAKQSQLFGQFLGESFLLTIFALLISIVGSIMLLTTFNAVAGKSLTAAMLLKPLPLLSLISLAVLISLFAGSYPAFILSNSKLINILKSGLRISSSGGALRKYLIVFQFIVSVFLIISTVIVLQQISYIQHKDLGYKKEHVLVFPVDYKMSENYEAIKTAISLDPNIISISGGYDSPTFIQWADGISAETGIDKKKLSVNANPVDLGYVKTMGMQIIAGTDFTRADLQLLDTSDRYKNYRYSFILNEKAVKELGWTPQEAIGKTIEKGAPGTIKAVVKDFHYTSLHEPIKPFVFFLNPAQVRQMFVKISGQNISKAIEHLSTVWKQRVAHRPFEYRFLDEEYNSLYTTEQRTAKVFATFSTLAILLACLGLFALTAYTVVQRTKEIGIRKVLGATVPNILAVISKDFIKLVIIAVVIATPVAWYTMHKWLEDFAYRININPAIFVLAALSTLLIALLTVIAQAIKVAIANPVKSLRTE